MIRFTEQDFNPDFYTRLGLPRTASQSEIKKAYRKRAMETHPDRNTDNPNAQAEFVAVGQAYEVLKDPSSKKLYDLQLSGQRTTSDTKFREKPQAQPSAQPDWSRSTDPFGFDTGFSESARQDGFNKQERNFNLKENLKIYNIDNNHEKIFNNENYIFKDLYSGFKYKDDDLSKYTDAFEQDEALSRALDDILRRHEKPDYTDPQDTPNIISHLLRLSKG